VLKNRVLPEIEAAVVAMAIDQPAGGRAGARRAALAPTDGRSGAT